jgi:hypothetical protein
LADAPIELVHRDRGKQILPEVTGPHCRAPLTARDMTARLGPALKQREASLVKRISSKTQKEKRL